MCWPQCLLYDILNCRFRVKPAILNFLQMTTAQDVETSVTVNNNSSIQDYVHPDDQTQPTHEMTPGFKPFTSDRSRGGAWGARPPRALIFRPTEAQRAEKNFLGRPGPPLSQGLNYPPPPPPLSEGVDRHCLQYLCLCLLATWFVCSDYSTSGVSLHGAGVS